MSMESILLLIVAAVVPAVATFLTLQVAKINKLIDTLPPIVKQVLALLIAFVFVQASALFGVPFPDSLAGLENPVALQTAVTGILSWIIHKLFGKSATATA